jgi:hypothetical protein
MIRSLRILICCAAVLGAFTCLSSSAAAGTTYDFGATVLTNSSGTPYAGGFSVNNINPALTTRIVVATAVGPDYDVTTAAGTDYLSGNVSTLSVGDTITVRQPSGGAVVETYVIPSPTVNAVVGGHELTGSIPAGLVGIVEGDDRCDVSPRAYSIPTGAFNLAYTKVLPGEEFSVTAFSPSGDVTAVYRQAPGETPCILVDGGRDINPIPGGPAPATPYVVQVDHLLDSVSASVRVVLRRGSTVIAENTADSDQVSKSFAQPPLPGDIIDVYRPKTAPAPTYSVTIPQISSVFDPTVDLLAVDAPASGLILSNPCRVFNCSNDSTRSVRDAPAGRSLLDFRTPQSYNLPLDLRPDDVTNVDYFDPDFTFHYEFPSHPGDLVAPAQSFKLPSKLKIASLVKALKKGYKVKLISNEAGKVKLNLGKLASIAKPVKVGSNTLRLKFSKSGKKQIKKLAAKGKKAKPLAVSLTSVVTDASGNASTIVKKTKIKP